MSVRLILGLVLALSPFIFLFYYIARYVLGWREAVKGLSIAALIAALMITGMYLIKTTP